MQQANTEQNSATIINFTTSIEERFLQCFDIIFSFITEVVTRNFNKLVYDHSTLQQLYKTRNPAIAEGPRDAGVPVEIW